MLRLRLAPPDPRRDAPLVPDHGQLMHLFLVREPALDAFAHLHPVRVNRQLFETPLPPLPAGDYALYAQITYETGFAETLTNLVQLSSSLSSSPSSPSPSPDDAWLVSPSAPEPTAVFPDGVSVRLLADAPTLAREPVTLRFQVSTPAGPARLEPYLGMFGHLVLRDRAGRVFTHLHPGSSFSMAAQQLFELREAGAAPRRVEFGADDPACRLPGLEESAAAWGGAHRRRGRRRGELSLRYFPPPARTGSGRSSRRAGRCGPRPST